VLSPAENSESNSCIQRLACHRLLFLFSGALGFSRGQYCAVTAVVCLCACDENVFLAEMIVVVTFLGGVEIWRHVGLMFSSLNFPS
jgi:hypothetical protein